MKDHIQILKEVAKGDAIAFRQLYETFSDKVYNTSLGYLQSVQDAEEVTQDVFTTIYNKADQFKGNSSVGTWIYRITINTSLNLIKKRKRFSFSELTSQESEIPNFEHPGILMEKKESAKILFEAINTLPANQKTAFVLSFVEGLPRQEVADVMEVSLKATESLLQRAKVTLREKLRNMYPHRRKNK